MREALFESAHPLATRSAQSRSRSAVARGAIPESERRDLEQEALSAVWKALPHYNPSRASLRTFVERVVATRLASLMRARRRRPTLVPLDDYQPVALNGIPALEFQTDFHRVSASLVERDRRLASMLADRSPTEAGRALRLSRSTVYEGIRRIRVAFEKAGFRPRIRRIL
jgi:RNA polymerase sigma factor (sigma-70 family)